MREWRYRYIYWRKTIVRKEFFCSRSTEIAYDLGLKAAAINFLQQTKQAVGGATFATSMMHEQDRNRVVHASLTGGLSLQFRADSSFVDAFT